MAPPKKNITPEKNEEVILLLVEAVERFAEEIATLKEKIVLLEEQVFHPSARSINKVESFNGELDSPIKENSNIKMNESDKLVSILNAVKILPPNLVDKNTGRHTEDNIGAICGFKVSRWQLDEVYKDFKHE
jgi:hypothetical protein